MQQFYFCFEYAHLPLFLYLLLEKKEYTKHALLCISREEKVIFFSALSVGVISILVCAVSNTKYIYPCNAETLIGNYYFDADTGRGIFSALTNSMPDTKHTLYRFVLNFFTIPCVLFFHVLGHKSWYVGGYYFAFLQAIWNAVSAVLLYSIVFKETSMKKLSICAAILFIVSTAFLWITMLPETFSLSVCALLLEIFLIQRGSSFVPAFAVIATGLNLFLGIICLPYIIAKAKRIFPRCRKIIFMCGIPALLLFVFIGKVLIEQYVEILNQWKLVADFLYKIGNLWPSVFSSGFLGPHIMRVGPYYMQEIRWGVFDAVILASVMTISLPILWKKKSIVIWSSLTLIFGGVFLHGVFGFGENVGFIYSPIYLPAVIILMTCGCSGYAHKGTLTSIFIGFTLFVGLCSATWLFRMGLFLNDTSFPIEDWHHPTENFTLSVVEIHYENKTLSSNNEILISGVDSIQISDKEKRIVGTTNDGKIFSLIVSDENYSVEYLQ